MDKKLKSFEDKEKNERILQEGRKRGFNIFKANEETARICRENEKKTPTRWPDDHEAYIDKLFGVR